MTNLNIFDALADPRRRAIFESLKGGAKSVGEIAKEQPVTRPAVSQHLKVLQSAGLVAVETLGTRRFYRIRRAGLTDLRHYIESFWQDTLEAFATHVNDLEKEK